MDADEAQMSHAEGEGRAQGQSLSGHEAHRHHAGHGHLFSDNLS